MSYWFMRSSRARKLTLRARLLWLINEWELYADRERERRARQAYRDAAAALRRTLARKRRGPTVA
jgi:hypothetical protein